MRSQCRELIFGLKILQCRRTNITTFNNHILPLPLITSLITVNNKYKTLKVYLPSIRNICLFICIHLVCFLIQSIMLNQFILVFQIAHSFLNVFISAIMNETQY